MALLVRSHGRGLLPLALFGLIVVATAGPAYSDGPVAADPDGDQVTGSADRCPKRPGLPPDGCPPIDSDGDRVADRDDRCPSIAGPPDNKGCPDKDSDADGSIDRLDRCPVVMGPVSLNGCPPPDEDDDGVPDASDRCPGKREVWNGRRDRDGCPDKGPAVVTIDHGTMTLARYPRLNAAGTELARSERWRIDIAARALRSMQVGALSITVRAEYGLSYGDSVQRATRRARAIERAFVSATKLPEAAVRVRALGPDGTRRIEIKYR